MRALGPRLRAELYALTHRGNPGDVDFYLRRARGARRVLELGCGSGRLLEQLCRSERALAITGLDYDADMLALARRSLRHVSPRKRARVRLVRGDMREFFVKIKQDRVFIPYNALYCLLNQREALSCFRAAHAALAAGGELVLDVWNAAQFHRAKHDGADEAEPVAVIEHAGEVWDVFERSRVRRASQRIHVVYAYVGRSSGAVVESVIPQRYYLAAELEPLLLRAGFSIAARYGDFSERRFTVRSPQLILVARA